MYGAILGDIIGQPYEFDRGDKTKDFPLFGNGAHFTDDSVMTVAVAEALLSLDKDADDEAVHQAVIKAMQAWGKKYPGAGYGYRFGSWLQSRSPLPYNSWGNGSAMRVSAAGWLYDTLEETRRYAKLTSEVTHNHPEGIKGAEAAASAIFMARNGATKEEIKDYVIREFGYDLSRTCDEIRPSYHHVESCQETVPEAITAFLEGKDFEDVIRTAVSLGGDCDTLTCIAGSIAEAFYGVPEDMKEECRKRVPEEMLEILDRFDKRRKEAKKPADDPFLAGNVLIEEAIVRYYEDNSKENLFSVLDAIRQRMHADGHFIFPVVIRDEEGQQSFSFRTIQTKDGKMWNAAFTSQAEFEKGAPSQVLSYFIDNSLKSCLESKTDGFIINPWGKAFFLEKELIEMIFKADGGVEYSVPDDPITAELLEDGSFLKRAVGICRRNRTQLNLMKLMRILRDSCVWIPCNAILSDADYAHVEKLVNEAEDRGDPDSMIGMEIKNQDSIRLVPDILQNGDDFFFPVFSSAEEMGEYGERFSKIGKHFLEALILARNNERNVAGIVINAFSEPFIIPREWFDLIAGMKSSLEEEGDSD